MSSQVEFLDRKINLAVSEIRNSAQLQSGEVLETLKKVDAHLEQVREYNKELRYVLYFAKRYYQDLVELLRFNPGEVYSK